MNELKITSAYDMLNEPVKMVSIPLGEYQDLMTDRIFLNCLQEGGVDNWDWYGNAIEQYHERKEEFLKNSK